MKEFLKGRKTYIIAFLMVLIGVVEGFTGGGWSGVWSNVEIILNGFGLGALRAGVAKT
jgi:hypothetical protein